MNVLEFNPDSCVLGNGVFLVSFRLLVEKSEARTWHFYGTLVPGASINGVPTVQHDAFSVLLDSEVLVDGAKFLAKDLAVAELSA